MEGKETKSTVTKVIVKANYSCSHYRRNCKFYAPCCDNFYRCRFCHDEKESHKFDREAVNRVQCSHCYTLQDLQQNCSNCGICFGKYFCAECKLYDNADEKPQFHCDGCGICRIGSGKEFFHCETCNMCLPIGLKGNHKCIKDVSRGNCPVCLEDIHTSGEPSQIPPCHHLIHKSCYKKLINNQIYYCPVCSRSYGSLMELWRILDMEIQNCPLPNVYKDLFVSALCRDCRSDSPKPFHFIGLKCADCGSYNTVRNKGPFLKRSGSKMVEYDPLECSTELNETSQSSTDPWDESGDSSWTSETNQLNECSNNDCDNEGSEGTSKSETETVARQISPSEE